MGQKLQGGVARQTPQAKAVRAQELPRPAGQGRDAAGGKSHVYVHLSPPPLCGKQLGGTCLLGVGIWVMVDPTGFREIIAANPLLVTGVYILLAMGGLLFLLGFLGCCGAVRENKCLLLFVSSPTPPQPWVP